MNFNRMRPKPQAKQFWELMKTYDNRMTKRPPFQIKICGITSPADAVAAALAGADSIGLNFFPESPRFVDNIRAQRIVEALNFACGTKEIARPLVVGVFVNSNAAQIAKTVIDCPLDAIQFHGQESTEILSHLFESLQRIKPNSRHRGLLTIRVIRLPASSTIAALPELSSSGDRDTTQMIDEALAWKDAGVDAILFDAAVPGEFGGSGKTIDWSLVRRFDVGLPLILAGGLNPQNVARAIEESGVQAVDVASGVESAPGMKDELLMQQFVYCTGLRG